MYASFFKSRGGRRVHTPTFQAKVLQVDLQVFKCPLQTYSLLKDAIKSADRLSCSRSSLETECDINLMQTT